MKNYVKPANDFSGGTPPLNTTAGEINTFLDRIETELELQYERISYLMNRIGPIICEEYPSDVSEQYPTTTVETLIGSRLATILSKISDRNDMIETLTDRVRI